MLALMAAPVAVAILVVGVRTGGLRALLAVRLRHTWLVGVAAVVQVVRLTEPEWATAALTPLRGALPVVVMWTLLTAFALGNLAGRSRAAKAGILVFLAGTTMNSAAMVANGGMPFSLTAARWAGFTDRQLDTHVTGHPPLTADSRLVPLADVIPVPLLPAVASVGDLLIFVGLIWLLVATMMRRPADAAAPAHRPSADNPPVPIRT